MFALNCQVFCGEVAYGSTARRQTNQSSAFNGRVRPFSSFGLLRSAKLVIEAVSGCGFIKTLIDFSKLDLVGEKGVVCPPTNELVALCQQTERVNLQMAISCSLPQRESFPGGRFQAPE